MVMDVRNYAVNIVLVMETPVIMSVAAVIRAVIQVTRKVLVLKVSPHTKAQLNNFVPGGNITG